MPVTTSDDFLVLLEKSGILKPAELAASQEAAGHLSAPNQIARTLVERKLLTEWQAKELLAGRTHLVLLEKYKLLDQLGSGGMGQVFLAEHSQMNRRVAIKSLTRRPGESTQRFLAEARAIAALDHPHIVRAHDVEIQGEHCFLIMEYIEGRDLSRMVAKAGPLAAGQAANYIRQAALGLQHMHSSNMIHRDVKPENMLVDGRDSLKIIDLGVAQLVDGGQSSLNGALGTVDYVAPEQAMGKADIDHRADIYSLGCTLYFLLTGHPPFSGSQAERLLKHQMQEPKPIGDIRSDVPAGLIEVCRRMMAKSPTERLQSAHNVAQALQPYCSGNVQTAPGAMAYGGASAAASAPVRRNVRARTVDLSAASVLQEDPGSNPSNLGHGSDARSQDAEEAPDEMPLDRRWLWAGVAGAGLMVASLVMMTVLLLSGDDPTPATADPSDNSAADSANRQVADKDASSTAQRQVVHRPESENPPAENEGPFDLTNLRPPGYQDPETQPKDPVQVASVENPPNKVPQDPKPEAPETGEPKSGEPGQSSSADKPDKPEKKDPETPKDPPAPEPEPFRLMAAAVDLPPLPSATSTDGVTGPVSLGEIELDEKAFCVIDLLGKEQSVLRGTVTFALRLMDRKTRRHWEVDVTNTANSPDPVPVASMDLSEGKLRFQWLPQVTEDESINYLRNCVLRLRSSGKMHMLPLRQPVAVAPIMIDLEHSGTKESVAVEWSPSADVFVEIEPLPENFPKHAFNPRPPVPLTGEPLWVTFGERDSQVLALRLEGEANPRRVELELVPFCQIANKQSKFTLQNANEMVNATMQMQQALQVTIEQAKSMKATSQQKSAEQQLKTCQGIATQLEQLKAFYSAINGSQLHYRITHKIGNQSFVLAETKGE